MPKRSNKRVGDVALDPTVGAVGEATEVEVGIIPGHLEIPPVETGRAESGRKAVKCL